MERRALQSNTSNTIKDQDYLGNGFRGTKFGYGCRTGMPRPATEGKGIKVWLWNSSRCLVLSVSLCDHQPSLMLISWMREQCGCAQGCHLDMVCFAVHVAGGALQCVWGV